MANVKHIFSGAGDPNLLDLSATIGVHHYCDDDTGDLWMSDTAGDWKLIYQGGSQGNIAFYGPLDSVPEEPLYPAIHFEHSGSASIWDGSSWREFLSANT